jgi:acylglycerol lipase
MSETFQLTASDNITLSGEFYNTWTPPSGLIVLIHGMGEHFGRYRHVAEFFKSRGYATVGMDLRGHGRSGGKRGHAPSLDQLLDDIDLLLKKANDLYSGVPLILYGHSMGGNLAANYVIRRKPALKALILTSPYFRLAFDPPAWKVNLGKVVTRIFPSLTMPTELEVEAISRDKTVVEAYKNDPLVHDKISAVFFAQVHPAGQYAIDHADEIKVKTLVIHGSADRITSFKATKEFAAKNPRVTLKIWEGFYHETHNEKEQKEVLEFVGEWVESV